MATLSSAGIGSGLDVAGIVQQLVAVERAPEGNRLTKLQTATTTKISGLATLKGALSSFQTALTPLKTTGAFSARSATSGDDKAFTATATSSAVAGSYDIEVVALAKAQQLVSDEFASNDTVVGTGSLVISLGDASFGIEVTDSNSTLAGIRDAINKSSTNPGVRATIVRATDGSHLVLTSAKTGAANVIKVTSEDASLSALTYDAAGANTDNYDELKKADDSEIKIAGFSHKSPTNVVSDAIDGVTFTLKKEQTEPDTKVTLDIANDTNAALVRVRNFVSQYNALQGQLANLQAFNPATGQAGQLLGDALARNVEAELRRGLTDPVNGASGEFQTLASFGITTSKTGALELNESKLNAALAKDFNAVGAVFGSETGVAARMSAAIEKRLANTGDIATRNASLDKTSKQITKDQAVLAARMERLTTQYTTQFTKLDSLLSNLQSTSNYLTQQLANLPTIS